MIRFEYVCLTLIWSVNYKVGHTNSLVLLQRLFVCPVDGCVLDFKRKDHLVRHVKLKHNVGEQPNVCSTSFDSNSALRPALQAEFPTEAAGPKTSESDMKRTILELREENARLQRVNVFHTCVLFFA